MMYLVNVYYKLFGQIRNLFISFQKGVKYNAQIIVYKGLG